MTAPLSITETNRAALVLALGLIDLDDRDRRLLDWLATWDQPTVEALCDLFHKLARPAVR